MTRLEHVSHILKTYDIQLATLHFKYKDTVNQPSGVATMIEERAKLSEQCAIALAELPPG
jgi:hypothetical protein